MKTRKTLLLVLTAFCVTGCTSNSTNTSSNQEEKKP